MIDIVIPNNNEEEFIEMAEKLGYKGLYFLYNFNDFLNKQKKLELVSKKIKVYHGILADNRNINKIKAKLKNKELIVIKSSKDDKEIIEKSKAGLIFSFEDSSRKDFIHQKASGLNHILCRSARENNVIIGFSINSILNAQNKNVILGRIKQNVKLCEKFKVKSVIASFATKPYEMRSIHDLISLFKILGFENPIFLNLPIKQQ